MSDIEKREQYTNEGVPSVSTAYRPQPRRTPNRLGNPGPLCVGFAPLFFMFTPADSQSPPFTAVCSHSHRRRSSCRFTTLACGTSPLPMSLWVWPSVSVASHSSSQACGSLLRATPLELQVRVCPPPFPRSNHFFLLVIAVARHPGVMFLPYLVHQAQSSYCMGVSIEIGHLASSCPST